MINSFPELGLIQPILEAVQQQGYSSPTPIQKQAIPYILSKKDVLAVAQTGTGKTAAFALPLLQRMDESKKANLHNGIRTLILTPTRELASQIAESFEAYGKGLRISTAVIFGGVNQKPQVRALRQGVDVLIATPGRLLDLMNQRVVQFNRLETFVLDEADRMLDMGFINDVRKVVAAIPKVRQTLFFSATMPPDIKNLADRILTQPVRIEVTPVSSTVEMIQQSVFFVEKAKKTPLLIELLQDASISRSLVFTRTKREANIVAESLSKNRIRAEAIHGNKSQAARERALENIKLGHTRVLVATDIAARGIDIDNVTHVFNFNIPNIPETYVHRIGRTARAGTSGIAVSFCGGDEKSFLSDVEKLIRKKIPINETPSGLVAQSRPQHPRSSRPPQHRQQRSEGGGHSFGKSGGGPGRPGQPGQAAKKSKGNWGHNPSHKQKPSKVPHPAGGRERVFGA